MTESNDQSVAEQLENIVEDLDWHGEHSNYAGRSIGKKQAVDQLKALLLDARIDEIKKSDIYTNNLYSRIADLTNQKNKLQQTRQE